MVSDKQVLANRENSLKSTSVLLRRECPRRFQGYVSSFYDEYKPETTTEVALVNMMATAHWKLMRMSTPNGKKGFFYETWAYGTADCKRISVPVTSHAGYRKDSLKRSGR